MSSPPATDSRPPAPSPAAVPTQPSPPSPPSRTKQLADRVLERFPSTKLDYARVKRVKVTVPPDSIKDVALFIRDQLGFDHVGTVAGTDYMQHGEMEVIYFVGSLSTPGQEDIQFCLAERVKRDSPNVPSLVEVWLGADYHERETYEMLGINFQGHPDLRRLLLPEDWNDLPPLRKDYTSPGR